MTNTRPRKKRARVSAVIFAVLALAGVAAIAAGIFGVGQTPTYQEAPVVAVPYSITDPDTYTGPHAVAPLPPDTLAVPSLNITAPITESSVDAQNTLQLPSPDKAGWYKGTVPAGALNGSTVIAGHVNFRDGSPGALGDLAEISKGAPIQVTDHTGAVHTYKAVSARTLLKTALPEELFTTTGPHQLVLITCGGPIVATGNGTPGYTHNTVITATPIRVA
jgi:LPXTG-site transpeptidase (sortase) family protein